MNELEIISLGGCGGFGMNSTLYLAGDRAILVDFGIGFPRGFPVGVAQVVPDARPLLDRCPRLDAVFITHGHDDHAAGLPHLPEPWRSAPVYAPPLALCSIGDRFEDTATPRPKLVPVNDGDTIESAPFRVTYIHVTHSIPQNYLLAIDTPAGLVVHSGDIKLDLTPVAEAPTDLAALSALRSRGVRLLLLDSTGSRRDGRTGSERSVRAPLETAIRSAEGTVVVSTFASHLHRIQTVCDIARRVGRKAALLGLRMTRTVRHGIDLGLFTAPRGLLVSAEELAQEPPERRLYLAGGCQGERQSSLSRLSLGVDPRAEVGRGDTVVVSASIIPGSEVQVGRLLDRFLRIGTGVIHASDFPGLHVSGHGSRDEIAELVELLRPQAIVPIHGDRINLEAIVTFVERLDPAPREALIIEKGDSLHVGPTKLALGDRIDLPAIHLDEGGVVVSQDVMRDRYRLALAGVVVVRVTLTREGRRTDAEARIEPIGIAGWDGPDGVRENTERIVRETAQRSGNMSAAELEHDIERQVGNLLRRGNRRRPTVVVMVEETPEARS
ncbi:MAG: ribonuclease J [Acidobacteria bacterium]|nr:ribonuclease J [Acidobacteriota bacterium]